MSEQHKIEIFQSDAPVHGWTLRICDRYQDHLTFGEMLEILIEHTRDGAISFPEKPHYGGLMTTEEHAQRFRAYAGLPDDGEPIDAEFEETEGQG